MKRIVTAAAAMLVAGVCVAQDTCCLQVFDFKASIKNSNVKQVTTKDCGVCDVKYVENNTLLGYLVTECNTCCSEPAQDCNSFVESGSPKAWMYLYRQADKNKILYKVPAGFLVADAFVKGYDKNCCRIVGPDAEGALWINTQFMESWGMDIMAGFFNTDMDLGFTTMMATGFGKVKASKSTTTMEDTDDDPCTPPVPVTIPGCLSLDTLSGSIVGVMEYDYLCNDPFQMLCVAGPEAFGLGDSDWFNAVLTGTWTLRRNTRMEACDEGDIEDNILAKLRGFELVDNAD